MEPPLPAPSCDNPKIPARVLGQFPNSPLPSEDGGSEELGNRGKLHDRDRTSQTLSREQTNTRAYTHIKRANVGP